MNIKFLFEVVIGISLFILFFKIGRFLAEKLLEKNSFQETPRSRNLIILFQLASLFFCLVCNMFPLALFNFCMMLVMYYFFKRSDSKLIEYYVDTKIIIYFLRRFDKKNRDELEKEIENAIKLSDEIFEKLPKEAKRKALIMECELELESISNIELRRLVRKILEKT